MKTRFRQLVPLSLAALLFLPELTSAQVVKRQPDVPLVRAASAGCGATNEGFLKIIVDASSPVDCDTTPEATAEDWVKALCICRDGSLESVYEGSFLLVDDDDDGQVAQGIAGTAKPQLRLNDIASLVSGDDETYFSVEDGALEAVSDGTSTIAGETLSLSATTTFKLDTGAAPTTAADTCTVNTVAISSTHIAVCVATNTWKRVAIATW